MLRLNLSKKKTPGETSKVVSGSFRPKINWHRPNRKQAVLIVVIAAVVLGGGYWVWHATRNNSPANFTGKLSQADLAKKVSALIAEKKYAEAQQAIDTQSKQAKNSPSNLTLQAEVSAGQSNYAQALAAYKAQAKQYGLTSGLALQIARLATQNKDYVTAVTYYNDALVELKTLPQIPPVKQQILQVQSELKQVENIKVTKK